MHGIPNGLSQLVILMGKLYTIIVILSSWALIILSGRHIKYIKGGWQNGYFITSSPEVWKRRLLQKASGANSKVKETVAFVAVPHIKTIAHHRKWGWTWANCLYLYGAEMSSNAGIKNFFTPYSCKDHFMRRAAMNPPLLAICYLRQLCHCAS